MSILRERMVSGPHEPQGPVAGRVCRGEWDRELGVPECRHRSGRHLPLGEHFGELSGGDSIPSDQQFECGHSERQHYIVKSDYCACSALKERPYPNIPSPSLPLSPGLHARVRLGLGTPPREAPPPYRTASRVAFLYPPPRPASHRGPSPASTPSLRRSPSPPAGAFHPPASHDPATPLTPWSSFQAQSTPLPGRRIPCDLDRRLHRYLRERPRHRPGVPRLAAGEPHSTIVLYHRSPRIPSPPPSWSGRAPRIRRFPAFPGHRPEQL